MIDWILNFINSITWTGAITFVGLFLLSATLSVVIAAIVAVKIPANYFSSHYQADFLPGSSWATRWGAVILKNLIGLVLLIAGIVMLIGPGQGILTILLGLILMDIPGKRPLEARIVKRPKVLSAINTLREKYNKPPLIVD